MLSLVLRTAKITLPGCCLVAGFTLAAGNRFFLTGAPGLWNLLFVKNAETVTAVSSTTAAGFPVKRSLANASITKYCRCIVGLPFNKTAMSSTAADCPAESR